MIARFCAALLTLLFVVAASGSPAQVYNPATTGLPPAPILPATPPQAIPGMAAPPAVIGESSRTSQHAIPKGMSVGRPARETHNTRSSRCAHQGAAIGIPPGEMGEYIGECVNNSP